MIMPRRDAAGPVAPASEGRRLSAAAPVRSLAVREVSAHQPAERSGLVRRDALCRRLDGLADDVSLILVVAPQGYGKTIALSQWMSRSNRAFAWVTVQATDNDPKLLLRHITRAMQPILHLDDGEWRTLTSYDASSTAVGVFRLLSAIRAAGSQVVLILDDLDVLFDRCAQDLVVALADGLPGGCHLAAASQSRPGLKLSRLRRQGRCVEFGPQDLAFSASEANDVLTAAGVDLPDKAARALLRRTEGWPTGIYVAAMSLRDKVDPAVAAEGLAGNDTLVADYFRNEVLAGLSAESVRFLLQTAALDRMSGPLCDAVLERTGSGAFLADLECRNLFVIPQDRNGEWYRYHRLFGQMLLSELRRREPGADLRLRRRAAAWYEENGMSRQAIASAIAGDDAPTASRLICTHGQAYVNLGQADMVRGWLESLGDSALDSYPPLAVSAGWIWAYAGNAARALTAVSAAERGTFDGRPPDGTSSLAVGTALIRAALAPHGVERMLVDAQFAFEREPPGSDWLAAAALLLGVGHLLNGAPGAAAKALEQAAYYGRGRQHVGAGFALGQLALLAAGQDDWAAAEALAAESWTLLEAANLNNFMPSMVAHVARATVAAHRRDTDAAIHYAGAALRLYARPSPVAFPWLGGQMAIALGRIFLELGDRAAALVKVREAQRHLSRLVSEGVLREQLRQLADDIAAHGDRPEGRSPWTLTAAEVRVLQLLPTHLSLGEIAHELNVSRNTVKAQVAAVYRKVGASTRAEAVQRGATLGLLGP